MKTAEKREPTVLRGVTQRYGEKTVFSDVSLTVERGARLALMAPSGAGKTTLLRLLMGLEMPTGGTVTGVPRRVAAVFQEDRLVEEATVLRNVMLVLPRRAARARATEILTALGLGGELSSLAGTLSGGMKRRVALARALAAESEMLVLDEPLTGLDAETKREALGVIGRYLGTRTLVLVTHDASEAEALGAERVTIGG